MTDTSESIEEVVQDAFTRALSNFKGTFSFERKVNLGDYNSATYGVFVQFDYAPEATAEQFLEAAREAALQAKAIVYEQAGIEAHLDDGGVLREVVMDAFPGATVEQQPKRQAQRSETVGATPPHTDDEFEGLDYSDPDHKRMSKANSEWAKQRYESHPQEFYDNRTSKKNDRAPDFRHKKHKQAVFWAK